MSFGSFSLRELAYMHCVYLALWTRKVLCGRFLCAIYKFSFIHSFIHPPFGVCQGRIPWSMLTHLIQSYRILTWKADNGVAQNQRPLKSLSKQHPLVYACQATLSTCLTLPKGLSCRTFLQWNHVDTLTRNWILLSMCSTTLSLMMDSMTFSSTLVKLIGW